MITTFHWLLRRAHHRISFCHHTFSYFHKCVCASTKCPTFFLDPPSFDFDYLCDPKNTDRLEENIKCRAGDGDLRKIIALHKKVKELRMMLEKQLDSSEHECMLAKLNRANSDLCEEVKKLPNERHPDVRSASQQPTTLEVLGSKRNFNFPPTSFETLAERMKLLRVKHLGLLSELKSYYLKGSLVHLENALIKFTVDRLINRGFQLVSVPDILHPVMIEACGMATKGERTQVYWLDSGIGGDLCLSGTAEIALAAYHMNHQFQMEELPQRLAAISRCYRAEVAGVHRERGLYRVHNFTKVEMFGITPNETEDESNHLLNEFVEVQKSLFSDLELHCQVLDMPANDLGPPAYRKFDIEAWMPGRDFYGEISSASNCTDYQSRRLHIKYKRPSEEGTDQAVKYVHTVNGTACAIPRMLIAIFENFQNADGSVSVPAVLRPYMDGLETFKPNLSEKMKWSPFKS